MNTKLSCYFFAVVLLLCATFAHSQGIRWDLGAPGSAGAVTTGGTGQSPVFALPGVDLNWCNHPANAVPCTNFATTYTSLSLSTPCASNVQVVLQGSNACQATGDNFGNLGVYTATNTVCGVTCYDYTLTVNGVSYGPYVWTGQLTSTGPLHYSNNYSLVQLFGDSITQGAGATTFMTPGASGFSVTAPAQAGYGGGTSPSGPTAYATRLLADFGNSGVNYGRGGDQAADMSLKVIANSNPGIANNPLTTMMISTNDVSVYGTNTNQQDTFTKALLFSAAWAAIPNIAKALVDSPACGTTGVWSVDSNAPIVHNKVTNANGATLTCNITTYGGPIYIFYLKTDLSNGTASVTIDGTAAPGPDANLLFAGLGGSSILTANGSHTAVALARYTGFAAGAHTVVVTATNTGTVELFGAGAEYPTAKSTIAPPAVFVGGTPWEQNDAGEPASGQYNAIIASSVTTLASDGLNVGFVNVRNCMNSTTDFTGFTDANGNVWAASWLLPLHPGDHGHFALYQCFSAAINQTILPSYALGIYGGPVGSIDGSLSITGSTTGGSEQTPTVLQIRNFSASLAQTSLNFSTNGGHLIALSQWGVGAGDGLPGVTGLFDTTKTFLTWNTTSNGDFCTHTATAYGLPNANACAGATLFVQGGNLGNAYRIGLDSNAPGIYNGLGAAGAEAILQIDSQAQAINADLVLQTNNASALPLIRLINKQNGVNQKDFAVGNRVNGGFFIDQCNDAENSCADAMTIAPGSLTPAFPKAITASGTGAALTGTGACATITTQAGGSWAGTAKCTGTTGASTLTITPGITAANGWTCNVQDETTRANLFQQTSHTQTTCVLTMTSVTQNDVFVFSAIAF